MKIAKRNFDFDHAHARNLAAAGLAGHSFDSTGGHARPENLACYATKPLVLILTANQDRAQKV